MKTFTLLVLTLILGSACQQKAELQPAVPTPVQIVDLGMLVTKDLPEKVWSREAMDVMGFTKSNQFEVMEWSIPVKKGNLTGSNAYYTLFNHGGTHIDGTNHMDLGGGIDSYRIEQFIGPLKVFDVSSYPPGRTVPVEVFEGRVEAGDVVLLYTNWQPPMSPEGFAKPAFIALTHKAAEYLAQLPVKSICTDAFSIDCFGDETDPIITESVAASGAPVHHSFLSRAIPIYEELINVDKLLDKKNMQFVGVPINIKDGDGMLVRPVALIY